MNVYFFGYHTDEECPEVPLIHKEEYTQEQFEEICAKAYKEEAKNAYKGSRVSEYFSRVLERLLNEHGFEQLEPIAKFSPFGWAAVNKDSDISSSWGDRQNKHNKLIKSKFKP